MRRLFFITLLIASESFANPKLENMFSSMDSNRDALVTQEEFWDYWQAFFEKRDADGDGILPTSTYPAAIAAQIDINGDGLFQLNEEKEFRMQHFDRMDVDTDLFLTLPEMLATRSSPVPQPVAPVKPPVKHTKVAAGIDAHAFTAELAQVEALAYLTAAPKMWLAEGFDSTDDLAAIYFDSLDWKGKPTKTFAWLGLPEGRSGKVPGIVLVHGGGGTAYKDWVQRWTSRGYAAISIAVEGQTDVSQGGNKWESHQWAGPVRVSIYGDSAEPIKDQWMYHAVANTILANSLLCSLSEVDAEKVGIMGISWGGVIVSTAIGLDSRFAFAILTYGCGALATAKNQYGRTLGNNPLYKDVWDPALRIDRMQKPTLWFSWPGDDHFPMDCLAASYGSMTVPYSVALVPGLRHGHGPPQIRSESYAFADSVIFEGAAWCRAVGHTLDGQSFTATFQSSRSLESATLIYTTDTGVNGGRQWLDMPAQLNAASGQKWTARASIPASATAYFVNVKSGDLIASSDYYE